MFSDFSHWYRTFWKLLTNPAIEIGVTIVVVMVATWYLVQAAPTGLTGVPLFGKH